MTDTNKLLEIFQNQASIHGKQMWENAETANKAYDKLHGVIKGLKSLKALKNLSQLTDHENDYVKIWAAHFLQFTEPALARDTLKYVTNKGDTHRAKLIAQLTLGAIK